MSSSYNVYVGPYIEIYNPIKNTKVLKSTCITKGCEQSGIVSKAKFCPDCVKAIGKALFDAKERVEFDVEEAFDGELTDIMPENEDENYFHLHDNEIDGVGRNLDDCEQSLTEITAETINQEITKLDYKYEEHIETLKKTFGEENVKVKWG